MTQPHNPNNTLDDDRDDLGGILWDDEFSGDADDGAAIAPDTNPTPDSAVPDLDLADFNDFDFAAFSDLGFDDLELETTAQNAPAHGIPAQNAPADDAPADDAPVHDALTQNALTQNALTQNALTQNALTQNTAIQNTAIQNTAIQNSQNLPTHDASLQNASVQDKSDTPRTTLDWEDNNPPSAHNGPPSAHSSPPPIASSRDALATAKGVKVSKDSETSTSPGISHRPETLDISDLNPLSVVEPEHFASDTGQPQAPQHPDAATDPTAIHALSLALETETAASLDFAEVDPASLDIIELHHTTRSNAADVAELDIAELDWADLGLSAADRPRSFPAPTPQSTAPDSEPSPPSSSSETSSLSHQSPPAAVPTSAAAAQSMAAIAPLADLLNALAKGGSSPAPAPPVASVPAPAPPVASVPTASVPTASAPTASAPTLSATTASAPDSPAISTTPAPVFDLAAAAAREVSLTQSPQPSPPNHAAAKPVQRDQLPVAFSTAALTNEALANEALANEALANEALANEALANEALANENLFPRESSEGTLRRATTEHDAAIAPAISTDTTADVGEDFALRQLQSLIVGDEVASLDSRIEQLREASRRLERMLSDPDSIIEHFSPLIARLIDRKVRDSSDEMCEAMLPIIDRLIYTRSQQDRRAMSRALAGILPDAISYQIRQSPRDIAKAIGPEISAAIREQIQLDRDSISEALSTEIGRTMKRQIEVERDAMIDALYPVIGNTIAKYLKEAVQAINEKIAESMSTQGITRKLRAKMQGVSEAELILKESLPFSVKAAFLIHKSTGLIVVEAQQPGENSLEADMLAGMLTAIRSFASDCMTRDGVFSELSEIEYGGSEILLEVAGYCYLAVIVDGVPTQSFLRDLRRTLGQAVERHGRIIETYDGDPTQVPKDLKQSLMDLLVRSHDRRPTPEDLAPTETKRGFPWLFAGAIAGAIALLAIPWGWWQWRNQQRAQVVAQLEAALDAAPDLSVYDLGVAWQDGQLVAQGRLPSEALQQRVTQVGEAAIAELAPNTPFVNETQAVRTIPDPAQVADNVRRTLDLLNQQVGSQLTAEYVPPDPERLDGQGHVNVRGTTRSSAETDRVIRALTDISGVGSVNSNLTVGIPDLPVRLYFGVESPQPVAIDTRGKVTPVRTFLDRYPDLNLRIVGYSPPNEPNSSEALASQRAQAVHDAFVNQGISPDRLAVEGRLGFPADVSPSQPDWMGRCVLFEAIGRATPSP